MFNELVGKCSCSGLSESIPEPTHNTYFVVGSYHVIVLIEAITYSHTSEFHTALLYEHDIVFLLYYFTKRTDYLYPKQNIFFEAS